MYSANEKRYDNMIYNRCGKSGLKLPAVSLGLWQNFGYQNSFDNIEKMCHTAFDLGITHFDLANNYGPEIGTAEKTFGKVLAAEDDGAAIGVLKAVQTTQKGALAAAVLAHHADAVAVGDRQIDIVHQHLLGEEDGYFVKRKSACHGKSPFCLRYIVIIAHVSKNCDISHTIYRKFG